VTESFFQTTELRLRFLCWHYKNERKIMSNGMKILHIIDIYLWHYRYRNDPRRRVDHVKCNLQRLYRYRWTNRFFTSSSLAHRYRSVYNRRRILLPINYYEAGTGDTFVFRGVTMWLLFYT